MAITSTQTNNKGIAHAVAGAYVSTSTAAAFTLTLGFTAEYFKIVNVASGGLVSLEWYKGMAANSAIKTGADGAVSVINTNGITVSAGTVTVGLDTDLNVVSEQTYWMAF